jgi:hypothetical protein
MSNRNYVAIAAIVASVGAAWAITSYVSTPEESAEQVRLRPTPTAPQEILKRNKGPTKSDINGPGPHKYTAVGPSPINIANVSRAAAQSSATTDYVIGGLRVDSKFSDEQIAAAVAAANAQPMSAAVQNIDGSQKPVGFKPKGGVEFNAIDAVDCCNDIPFSATVPPDIDMAAGPNHLIAVVNVAFEIYDKQGNSLTGGPIGFASFFAGTPGCSAASTFDPDVVYDPVADRFVIGVDGGGTDFCVAATQTGDPTGAWNRYGFPTNVNGAFFDFPHMGVGQEAIFMGSNQFGGFLPYGFEGRVFAMDKVAMYIQWRRFNRCHARTCPTRNGRPSQRQARWHSTTLTTAADRHAVLYHVGVFRWQGPFRVFVAGSVRRRHLGTGRRCRSGRRIRRALSRFQLFPHKLAAEGIRRDPSRQ